jgi:butyrate kinase
VPESQRAYRNHRVAVATLGVSISVCLELHGRVGGQWMRVCSSLHRRQPATGLTLGWRDLV